LPVRRDHDGVAFLALVVVLLFFTDSGRSRDCGRVVWRCWCARYIRS